MSSKKKTSKKATSRSAQRKVVTKNVTKAATPKADTKPVPVKAQPLTMKPDQMGDEVLEFIQAIDDYKRNEGRPFPTWSEILDIVKELGYERTEA